MGSEAKYRRALVKISGESLSSQAGKGIDDKALDYIAGELVRGHEVCPALAVVVGGGNIMRGAKFCGKGISRIRADHAGMVATVVNALVLQDKLESAGVSCSVYSGLAVAGAAEAFHLAKCEADLQQGKIVLLAGGTGQPLFTTDTAAALRAVQLRAEVLLKATKVEGIHSADPHHDSGAELFERLTYEEILKRKLGVMDLCAISLCMEHRLPLRVFNYKPAGNIRRALLGERIGTLVGSQEDVH